MSRLTFRKPAGEVAWQKQLRDRYLSEGAPPLPHLSVKRAIVKPITRKMAKQIILQYEWLGKMANTSLHYGIFFGLYCAGVACVGYGASMAGAYHHEQFGIIRDDMLTLARGACVHWAPPLTNSRLISWTCKLLQRGGIGKLIWATADSDAGEIGTIYQACNWVYVGLSSGAARRDSEVIAPNGRAYNRRSIGGWAQKQGIRYVVMKDALLSNGWAFQPGNPKHRYVYVLDRKDKQLAALVESMRQPYPKRSPMRPADGSGPDDQSELGGSTPTRTLKDAGREPALVE